MTIVNAKLDQEWVNLILAARALGLSKEQIRGFLEREGKKEE